MNPNYYRNHNVKFKIDRIEITVTDGPTLIIENFDFNKDKKEQHIVTQIKYRE